VCVCMDMELLQKTKGSNKRASDRSVTCSKTLLCGRTGAAGPGVSSSSSRPAHTSTTRTEKYRALLYHPRLSEPQGHQILR